MTAGAARAGEKSSELARTIASFLWVLAATAASIAALGALPGWLGADTGPERFATVQAAEKRLGARILVPGYFPERLAWPPEEIRVAGGRHGSVLLAFRCRDGGPPIELLQATEPGEPIAEELLAGRTVLKTDPARVEGRPAKLSQILLAGTRAHELVWEVQGRAMVLRSTGDLEELFRMARTSHREGGR